MEKRIFYFIFFVVYLIGGTIQFLGILSNTKITILLTLIIIPFFFVNRRRKYIQLDKIAVLFFSLSLLILISGIKNETSFDRIIFYFIFVVVPFNIYNLFEVTHDKDFWERALKFFFFIGLIQLPVIVFQSVYYDKLIRFSSYPSIRWDFDYGTFFLQNDHGLTFFILCLIVLILFNNRFIPNIKKKLFVLLWFSMTILLTYAKTAHFLLLIIFVIFFLYRFWDIRKIIFFILFAGCFIGLGYFTNINNVVMDSVMKVYSEIENDRNPDFERTYHKGVGSRFVALKYFMNRPLKLFGEGPFASYNPLNKKYGAGANHSQLLWFYYDIGIFGPILLVLILLFQAMKLMNDKLIALLLFAIICIYSFVTNVFSDMAILISYNFFLRANIKSNNEYNSNSIP